ncbi:MAG: AtpZ/AtpI family protein [Rhodothermales bacterium]|nr:AtpZ/AtpI family protein [Rhodothermales bacterium]
MTSKPHLPDESPVESIDSTNETGYKPRHLSKGDGLNIGLTIGATMAIFVIGGNWLDQKLGTDPWLTLIGAVFALTSIVLYLLKIAKR